MSLLDLQKPTTQTRIIALIHGHPKSGKTASTLSLTQIEGHTVGFIALDANSRAGLKAGMGTPTIPKNPANFKNFHNITYIIIDGLTHNNRDKNSMQQLNCSALP